MEQQPIRPDPSIETWEEACAVSQQWAYSARLAAQKRRKRYRIIYAVMLTIPTLALIALLTLIIVNHA